MLTILALAAALAGCQRPGSVAGRDTPVAAAPQSSMAANDSLQEVPPCERGAAATLSDGIGLTYQGADPDDPLVCLVSWNGRMHRYFAGFWGAGRFNQGTPVERAAILHVLSGPVGAKASFEDVRAKLWGKVTIEHVASPMLQLATGPRRAILLRVVKHDQRGRPDVQAETLHWIDAETGVVLKQATVTTMADGEQTRSTTWQVERIDASARPSTEG